MFLYVICPFFVREKVVILGQKGKAAGHFCTRTPTKFTGGEKECGTQGYLKSVLHESGST